MVSPQIKNEIYKQLDRLEFEQQRQVLQFAHTLANSRKHGVSRRELLHFAGTIDKSDLEKMTLAIEEECEKVNLDDLLLL